MFYVIVKLFETLIKFAVSPLFWIFLISAGVFSTDTNFESWSSELALLFAAITALLFHVGKAIYKLIKNKIRKIKP